MAGSFSGPAAAATAEDDAIAAAATAATAAAAAATAAAAAATAAAAAAATAAASAATVAAAAAIATAAAATAATAATAGASRAAAAVAVIVAVDCHCHSPLRLGGVAAGGERTRGGARVGGGLAAAATGGDVTGVAEERHTATIPRRTPASASRGGAGEGLRIASLWTGRPAVWAARWWRARASKDLVARHNVD